MSRRRKVLITGGGGFIGSYCLPLLVQQVIDVVAVTTSAARASAPGIQWRQCNLLDPVACRALIDQERPTHLLHLAWITAPGLFWSSHDNLQWLAAGASLADAFFAAGGERFVGLGSCAEYLTTDQICVEDQTPIIPETVYGKAKAAMALALEAAAQGRGSFAWGRLFFPYGPGEPLERFVPAVIDGLVRGLPIACTHGRQERDLIFVADAAAACVALLTSDASGAFNISSGVTVSLRDVADLICARLGGSELLRFGERQAPAFDPPRIVADISKIRRDTGWHPSTSLADGLDQTICRYSPPMRQR
jgi:nucleoside-diphosphate-sugar epimerase